MDLLQEMREVALLMLAMVMAFMMLVLGGVAFVGLVGGVLTGQWPPVLAGLACAAGSFISCLLVVLLNRQLKG